jgi:hypothetical protein
MIAVGVHTFFIGFQRGMESVLGKDNVLGSMEGWEPGIEARAACGAGHIPINQLPNAKVDLVFSNPPCSRYSSMSTGCFTGEDKSKLVNFCELGTAVDVAMQLNARALWWETGPLLWSKGMDMVQDVHAALERAWGEPSTTVVVKMDLRHFGVPQRRPRCHILHARGLWEPPQPSDGKWPLDIDLRTWLDPRVPHRTRTFHPLDAEAARKTVIKRRLTGTFASSIPTMIKAGSMHAPAVISSREFAWEDTDAWWTVEEYAALMCYPVEETCAVADEFGPRRAKTMLAKSVSPSAAAGVWTEFFEPTLRTPGSGGVWRVKSTVPEGDSCALKPEIVDDIDIEKAFGIKYRRIVQ